MVNFRKRFFLFLVFLMSLGGIALIAAAFSTEWWVFAWPVRNVDSDTKSAAQHTNTSGKFTGNVHLGIFHGSKVLDNGLGTKGREHEIWVTRDMAESHLFNFGLWVSCLLFACLSVAWAMISSGFALLNMNRKPVETISGPLGLYLWNFLAVICQIASVSVYAALFHYYLRKSVLTEYERNVLKWTSEDRAALGYSFYLGVAAAVVFLLNELLVYLSGVRLHISTVEKGYENEAIDGVMLY